MGKYRKKPVVIEAEQFYPHIKPWPEGVYAGGMYCSTNPDGELCILHKAHHLYPIYNIDTLEGDKHIVSTGDWIITGVKGEKYPCKPDIFEATYEAVSP